MWVSEQATFTLVFAGALVSLIFTLIDETDVEDPDYPTYYAMLIRRPIFGFAGFYLWAIWSGMASSLNNCATQFAPNQCFTNAAQTTSTATITPEAFAGVLGQLGFVMAAVTFLLAVFFTLLSAYAIAKGGYVGRRARPKTQEPE